MDFSNPSVYMEFSVDDDSKGVSCESFCEESIFVGSWAIEYMIDTKSQSAELKLRAGILPSFELKQYINYGEQLWRHRIDV